MKYLKICGKIARRTKVDDDVYIWALHYKWYLRTDAKWPDHVYVVRLSQIDGKNRMIRLHREIMGVLDNPKQMVDHINGDTFDNRRSNLRLCTARENTWNSVKYRKTTSSRYKGVYWHTQKQLWLVRISISDNLGKIRTHSLGLFANEKRAARAYDAAAIVLFKEFANTNFSPSSYSAEKLDAARQIVERPRHKKASKFIGVSLYSVNGWTRWVANIHISNQRKSLGYFEREEDAAQAYDAEARKLGRDTNF